MPVNNPVRCRLVVGWMLLAAWSLLPGMGLADDVAQVTGPPPAVYKDNLAKMLTPLEEVLKKKSEYSRLEGDGIVLLDEMITYVTEDGKRISVFHSIDEALNDAGGRSMAQD